MAMISDGMIGFTGGGIGDYWRAIVVLLVIAAAIWYYMRGRNRV
jgi:hypothetical protein